MWLDWRLSKEIRIRSLNGSATFGFVDAVYLPTTARARSLALGGLGEIDAALATIDAGLAESRRQGLLFDECQLLRTHVHLARSAGMEPPPSYARDAAAIADRPIATTARADAIHQCPRWDSNPHALSDNGF